MKRYSPLDRDEVHADLRVDPAGTRRAVERQPGVREAHRGCEVCAELDPRPPAPFSRRAKVALSIAELAAGLPLPPDARPVRMYVDDDPQYLYLVFESAELDAVPLDQETPIALLRDVDDVEL